AAFESGEFDAAAVSYAPHAHFSFDTTSRAEWWTSDLNPGVLNCPVVVNADALAAPPAAHWAALDEAVGVAIEDYLVTYADLQGKWAEALEVFSKTDVDIPAEAVAKMRRDASAQIIEAPLAEMGQSGWPGKALLEQVTETLAAERRGADPSQRSALRLRDAA
ncbi:MAG: hypothetical protein AAF360_16960, partial [Pseudomonadota bacterium]